MQKYHKLRRMCRQSIADFRSIGTTVTDTKDGQLVHIDNNSDILAVGHLDTVLDNPPKISKGTIRCGQLDDRLGVWGLLHGLQRYTNVPFDILLCDGEEVGRSTARHFETNKAYKWGFELDRAGNDCVLYQYEGGSMEKSLESDGWDIGNGAFSDISDLSHLGCQFVNFGIAYHDQHTARCHAKLSEVETQLQRVGRYLDKYEGYEMPFVPIPDRDEYEYDKYGDWRDAGYACICGRLDVDEAFREEWLFCPYCGDTVSY